MKKEEILKKLKEINKKKYSILKLGLFGSFSKNKVQKYKDEIKEEILRSVIYV